MKKIKEYLEDTIANMLFESVLSFWEPPTPKQAFKEEMHELLVSVEKKLIEKMENHERFVDEE